MLLMAFCLLIPQAAMADKASDRAKQNKNEARQFVRDKKKAGWILLGSSRPFESTIIGHYERLYDAGANAREIVGLSQGSKSKNVGKQRAISSAYITYAQSAGGTVKGRVIDDMAVDALGSVEERDKFLAAYERLVEQQIKNEMRESFSLIREAKDGTYEVEVYFIVDEAGASKARLRAMEQAIQESELAKRHADVLTGFARGEVEFE